MRWNDYQLILAVARAQRLPEAAEELGLTVSTMFRRIERIEEMMSGPIFERQRGVYRPNPVGAELVRAAELMEDQALLAERKIESASSTLTGVLTIAASETLALSFLPRQVARLNAEHPDLQIHVLSGNEVLSLTNREADVALRPVRPRDTSLFGRKLTDIHWAVYGDPQAKERNVEALTVEHEHFIGLRESVLAEWVAQLLQTNFPKARVSNAANSLVLMASCAAQGCGLALLPMPLGERWPGLHRISNPIRSTAGELWVVCHKDMRQNQSVRVAFDALIKGALKEQHLFRGVKASGNSSD